MTQGGWLGSTQQDDKTGQRFGLKPLLILLSLKHLSRLGKWMGLNQQRTTQTQNKRFLTQMGDIGVREVRAVRVLGSSQGHEALWQRETRAGLCPPEQRHRDRQLSTESICHLGWGQA